MLVSLKELCCLLSTFDQSTPGLFPEREHLHDGQSHDGQFWCLVLVSSLVYKENLLSMLGCWHLINQLQVFPRKGTVYMLDNLGVFVLVSSKEISKKIEGPNESQFCHSLKGSIWFELVFVGMTIIWVGKTNPLGNSTVYFFQRDRVLWVVTDSKWNSWKSVYQWWPMIRKTIMTRKTIDGHQWIVSKLC